MKPYMTVRPHGGGYFTEKPMLKFIPWSRGNITILPMITLLGDGTVIFERPDSQLRLETGSISRALRAVADAISRRQYYMEAPSEPHP